MNNTLQTNEKIGMISLDKCLANLYLQKKITLETAKLYSMDITNLLQLCGFDPDTMQ